MNPSVLLDNLSKKGYQARYFQTGKEAADFLTKELHDTTIGFGGSMTTKALNLYELLGQQNEVFWHWEAENRSEAEKKAAEAAVYILSANAIAETGEIVNIDGSGNRVAAAFYGHQRVIFVVGVNKIAADLPAAIDRARNVASPLNARRLQRKTPCALSEPMRCHDCKSPERICNGMSVLYNRMWSIPQMDVILIGEELGY